MASGFVESLSQSILGPHIIFVEDSLVEGFGLMGFEASGYSEIRKKLDPSDLLIVLGLTYKLNEILTCFKHLFKGGRIAWFVNQRLIFSTSKGFVPVKNIDTHEYLYRYRRLSRAIGNSSLFGYRRLKQISSVVDHAPAESFTLKSIRRIAVALGNNWKERQVNLHSFSRLIKQLPSGSTVTLLGLGRSDEEAVNQFLDWFSFDHIHINNMVSKTTFKSLIFQLRDSDLFIGGDCGISHLAYHLGLPIFVMGGCVPASWRYKSKMAADEQRLRHLLDGCQLCARWPCYDGLNPPTCKNKTPYICTQHLTASLLNLEIKVS